MGIEVQSRSELRASYDDAEVQALFNRMGPTYDFVNLISSFGFSELWRRQCVRNAAIFPGARVCDMMSGSGECWRYLLARGASLVSVDFSRVMIQRQTRRNARLGNIVDVRCENALRTSLESGSMDCVVGAFGLKTLTREALERFANEIRRILRPGGRFSLIEISTARGWWLSRPYRWYLNTVIPLIGKMCLGDIDCYRTLGVYTRAFGSCDHVTPAFAGAGLRCQVWRHFHGCATSIAGSSLPLPSAGVAKRKRFPADFRDDRRSDQVGIESKGDSSRKTSAGQQEPESYQRYKFDERHDQMRIKSAYRDRSKLCQGAVIDFSPP